MIPYLLCSFVRIRSEYGLRQRQASCFSVPSFSVKLTVGRLV